MYPELKSCVFFRCSAIFNGARPRSCKRTAHELFTVYQAHFGDSFNDVCLEHLPRLKTFKASISLCIY